MGANIDANGNIEIDFSHERLIDTSLGANPTILREDGFAVLSLMRRKNDDVVSTDGNPVIHALKKTRRVYN